MWLQIASIYYLKINKAEEATKHLRKLVIENYNTKTNSQLLSFIYLQETVFDTNKFIPNTLKYKELVQFTDRTNLIPWVDSEKELTKEHLRNINELFLNNQKNKLYSYFEAIVNTIFHKEIISYNKELYDRHNMVDVDDAFFEDTIDARKERDEVYKKLSSREGEWKRFTAELSKGTIIISLNKHINKLLRSLDKLVQIAFNLNIDPGKDLASIKEVLTSNHFSFKEISIDEAKSSITDNSIIQQIKYLKNKIEKNEFDFEDYLRLSFLTLTTIMEKFIEDFVMNFWTKAIAPQNAYKELVNIESNFTDFCNVEGLPSLEQLCSQGYNNRNIPEEYKIFDLFSCFEDGKNIEEQIRIEDNLTELFKSYEEKGTLFKENKDGLKFTTDTVFINNHLKTIPNNDATIIRNKGRVLAYFHDQKEWYERHIDVFFMKKGFYFRLDAKMSTSKLTFIPYNKIEFDRIKKGLKYKNEIFYQSSQINLEVLYQLIAESSSIASEFKDRKI